MLVLALFSETRVLVVLLQFDIYKTVFYVFSVIDFSMIVVEYLQETVGNSFVS